MATRKLYEAYTRARREHFARTLCDLPPWTGAARDALRIARGELRNAERFARLDVPRYSGEHVAELDGGLRLVYTVESDEVSQWEDRGAPKLEWLRYSDHVQNMRAEGMPDGWIDREGSAYWQGDRAYTWARVDSEYSLADRVRDNARGMSRAVSWLEARRSIAREYEFWRPFFDGHETWVWLRVELQNVDGDELASDSIGGVESVGDYWRECLADLAEQCLAEYRDALRKRIPDELASIAETRRAARGLCGELRALGALAGKAPHACGILRRRIREYRDHVRACVASLRNAREALRAVELATGGAP